MDLRTVEVWRFMTPYIQKIAEKIIQVPLRCNVIWLVVSNICCYHPYFGKIPILTNIFQRDWNHQPEMIEVPLQKGDVLSVSRRSVGRSLLSASSTSAAAKPLWSLVRPRQLDWILMRRKKQLRFCFTWEQYFLLNLGQKIPNRNNNCWNHIYNIYIYDI